MGSPLAAARARENCALETNDRRHGYMRIRQSRGEEVVGAHQAVSHTVPLLELPEELVASNGKS